MTAALRQAEAAQVLVRAAQLNLKPKVDLNGDVHFTGLDEDVVTRAFKRWVGPSYKLGLERRETVRQQHAGGPPRRSPGRQSVRRRFRRPTCGVRCASTSSVAAGRWSKPSSA